MIVPSRCVAKGATTKIVIEGTDLAKRIEIADRKVGTFNVWDPGTFSTKPGFNANAPSFIDWSITQSLPVLSQAVCTYLANPMNGGDSMCVQFCEESKESGFTHGMLGSALQIRLSSDR